MQLENWMCPKCYKTHWSIGVDESDRYIVCKGCGHKSPNVYRMSGGRGILPENEEVEKIILKKKHNEENDVLYLKKKEWIEYLKSVRTGSIEFKDAIDDIINYTSKTKDYYDMKLFVLNMCKERVVHPTFKWEWLNEKLYEIFYGKMNDVIYRKMLKKVKNMECGVDDVVDPEKLSYFKSLFIYIEESFFGFKEVYDALKILSEREKYLNGWHKHRQRAEWINEFIMILDEAQQNSIKEENMETTGTTYEHFKKIEEFENYFYKFRGVNKEISDIMLDYLEENPNYYNIKLFIISNIKNSESFDHIHWILINHKLYEIFYGKNIDDENLYKSVLKRLKILIQSEIKCINPKQILYFNSLLREKEYWFFGFKELCDFMKIRASENKNHVMGEHEKSLLERKEWNKKFLELIIESKDYVEYSSAQEKLIESAMYEHKKPYYNIIKINEKLSLEKILNYIGKNITLYDVTNKYFDAIEMIDSTGLALCNDVWYIKMKQSEHQKENDLIEHVSTENLFDDVDIAFSEFKRLRKT